MKLYTFSPQKNKDILAGELIKKPNEIIFKKAVISTKHKMRLFEGYGIQKDIFDKYLRGKKGRIIIKEKDTGKVLVASIKTWQEHCAGANYGDGKQIFLATRFMHNADDFNRQTTKEEEITNEDYHRSLKVKLTALKAGLHL